ncbi:MAG: hypothetical protein M1820_006856 [Bogoriella megaspora]|nr:MAG: hypothetical protein M1820_006856 [Bogoriella megaspora]
MALESLFCFGFLLLGLKVSANPLPQLPIVGNNGIGGNAGAGAGAGAAATAAVGGAANAVTAGGVPTVPSLTAALPSVPSIPSVPSGTAITKGLGTGLAGGIVTGAALAAPIPGAPAISTPPVPAITPLLQPIPLSPGIISPLAYGTLNVPGLQNSDLGALSTFVTVNPAAAATNLVPAVASTVTNPNLITSLTGLLIGLFSSIFQNEASNVVSSLNVTTPPVPAAVPLTNIQPGGANIPAVTSLPTANVLPAVNPTALPAGLPSLSPRAPQLGVKTILTTGVVTPIPVSNPTAVSPAGLGGLPLPGTPAAKIPPFPLPNATTAPSPPLNLTAIPPVSTKISLPTSSIPPALIPPPSQTVLPPIIPVPAPSAIGSTPPEGYGSTPNLPPELSSIDGAIDGAAVKLGQSEALSNQVAELVAALTVLGLENPLDYGDLTSLNNLGAIEEAASSINPEDLDFINTQIATQQIPNSKFLFNVVDFVKTIEDLLDQVTDLKDSIAYLLIAALATS